MNKHELKSLLENIYTALTEADIPDNPPVPGGWDQNSPEPWPWPKNSPPATTPTDPVRGPYDPARDPDWTPPNLGSKWYWRYENGYWVLYSRPTLIPNPIFTDPAMEDWEAEYNEERFRDFLRELGIDREI